MQAEVGVAELAVAERLRKVAAVLQRHADVGQPVAVHVHATDVAAAEAGDDPGVLAAGVAFRLRAVGVEIEMQPVARLPAAIPAELRRIDDPVFGDRRDFRHQLGDGHPVDPAVRDADVAPAMQAGALVEDGVLDVERLVIADGRRVETREEAVDRHAEAVRGVPLPDGGDAAALLLLHARAEAGAAQAEQRTLGFGDLPVAVRVELAGRVGVDEEFVQRVRADFGVLVDAGRHEAHPVVGEGRAEHAADLEPVVLREIVVIALGRERHALADAFQRPGRAQVDRAADAALEVRGFGGLQDVRAGDHLRRQHVECELAAVTVRRQDPAVQRDDAELGPEATHVHVLALAAAGARHGDAGDVRERVRDVVVGEAARGPLRRSSPARSGRRACDRATRRALRACR